MYVAADMILIPFAVKQAQTGLDSDAAVMSGRNAYSQFEIGGYRFPQNWAVYNAGVGGEVSYSPFEPWDSDGDGAPDMPAMPPEIISIDPLGIAENGLAQVPALAMGPAHLAALFPFNRLDAGTAYPASLLIGPANLGTPSGATMADSNGDGFVDAAGQAMARRLFRSFDDLVFSEAIDELTGPEQVFNQGAVGALQRQSVGRISWSAIVVPFKDDPLLFDTTRWSYKIYILVYKDRNTVIAPTPDPDDQMATAMVTNTGVANPVSTVFLETGVSLQGSVSRDEWVMLINRNTASEPGFDRQLAFYRIVSYSDDPTGTIGASLTLDGPGFTFQNGAGTFEDTFVVHLQNVVGVYERTFVPESESNWNISL